MSTTFKEIRKLQGERVLMKFDDGREVVATLLCATKDIDGSKHLIYDHVEEGNQPQAGGIVEAGDQSKSNPPAKFCACGYADAKTLVEIEPIRSVGAVRSMRVGETLPPRPAVHVGQKAWSTGA